MLPETQSQTPGIDDLPIGVERPLTFCEQLDLDILGKPREEIAEMTPKQLRDLTDMIADRSPLFVGS